MKKNTAIPLILLGLLTVASVTAVPAAGAPREGEIFSEKFLCNLSQATTMGLPGSTPASSPEVDFCGNCGQTQCNNRSVGYTCILYDTGGMGTCQPDGVTCVDTGRPRCQCGRVWYW